MVRNTRRGEPPARSGAVARARSGSTVAVRRRPRRGSGAIGAALATALGAASLHAQPAGAPPVTEQTAAQVLADEAQGLIAAGRVAEGCDKLAESQRLVPAPDKGLSVGACYERAGKLASAWLHYRLTSQLSGDAARAGADPEAALAEARRREAQVEPRISKVRVKVLGPVDGLQVTRSGVVVARPQWDVAVPVDDGLYDIEATASGHRPWQKRIHVGGAELVTVMIPALAPIEPKTTYLGVALGSVVAGSGLALMGVGLAYGFIAKNKRDDSELHCPRPDACLQQGVTLNEEAHDAADVSTGTFVAGTILVVGGIVTWIVVPNTASDEPGDGVSDRPAAARSSGVTLSVTPVASPEGAGLWLGGRF